jgi:hypothetical protein
MLAISGEYLYFTKAVPNDEIQVSASLMRCEKTKCAKAAQVVLDSPYRSIAALQIVGDRIGIVSASPGTVSRRPGMS